MKLPTLEELLQQSFEYFDINNLNGTRCNLETNYTGNYKIAIEKMEVIILKEEYKDIKYLEYHAKNDSKKLFQDTFQQKVLIKFVSKEFNFEKFFININETLTGILLAYDNPNSQQLHQLACKNIYSLIGDANKDLQQVCYRLSYDFIGHVFFFGLCIIWKFYETKNWNNYESVIKNLKDEESRLKEFYFKQTSSDYVEKDSNSVENLMSLIEKIITSEIIPQKKKNLIDQCLNEAKSNKLRERVQIELDNEYLSRNSTATVDELYDYIKNPEKFIKEKYTKQSNVMSNEVRKKLQEDIEVIEFFAEFKSRLSEILSLLEMKLLNAEEKFSKSMFDLEIDENMQEFLKIKLKDTFSAHFFNFLIDILLGSKNLKYFEEINLNNSERKRFNFLPKKNILTVLESVKPIQHSLTRQILDFLRKKQIFVINYSFFLKKTCESLELLMKNLKQSSFVYQDSELEIIPKSLICFICKQKCPCCGRICGEEDPSHTMHKVLYGHQIRGMNGIILTNKEASVSTCAEIKDTDDIVYNGNFQTWMDFKDYYKNLANDPWSFDDTKNSEIEVAKFHSAWIQVGRKISLDYKSYGMIFVEKNVKGSIQHNQELDYYINTNNKPAEIFDNFNNPAGSDWDLGKDGKFVKYKIIVGQFYTGEGFTKESFDQTAGSILKQKAFKYDVYTDELKFIEHLNEYHIAFVISSPSSSKNESMFADAIEKFFHSGKSLFIFGDNQPFYVHANLILKKLFGSMQLIGNFMGTKTLLKNKTKNFSHEKSENNSQLAGTFSNIHPISYGLDNIYEGITICHPINMFKDFEVFSYASDGNANTVILEKTKEHGRIVIDCGYTKLWKQFWNTAGTGRYISNACVWLTGISIPEKN